MAFSAAVHGVRRRLAAGLRGAVATGWRGVATAVSEAFPEQSSVPGFFRRDVRLEGVTIVATPEAAARALEELHRHRGRPHAWDTETADVVVGKGTRSQSPVNHGRAVCATCFCGEDADFGHGPRLFIDNAGAAADLLLYFREYFEDERFQKVFHNYAFDRHILRRHGIHLRGLHADTLHLARLYDTSLSSWEGAVQAKLLPSSASRARAAQDEAAGAAQGSSSAAASPARKALGFALGGTPLKVQLSHNANELHTLSTPPDLINKSPVGYGLKSLASRYGLVDQIQLQFAERFGVHARAAQEVHDSPEAFPAFVEYSTQDAVLTHRLYEKLRQDLQDRAWSSPVHEKPIDEMLRSRHLAQSLLRKEGKAKIAEQSTTGSSMWRLFELYIRDMAECLADMEAIGIGVDRERLEAIEEQMLEDIEAQKRKVVDCLSSVPGPDGTPLNPDLELLNYQSSKQLQVLIFGGAPGRDTDDIVPATKQFTVEKQHFRLNSLGLVPSYKMSESSPITGMPKVSADVLKQLSGDPLKGVEGIALQQLLDQGYEHETAHRICRGLQSLREVTRTKRMLANSIAPLQRFSLSTGRIHSSWQFDTATGRLVSRGPNLQNLPSVEQDKYGIRDCFRAKPGHAFVIADYAQLELCILAHMANCSNMINTLDRGGDYHSEVAAEMFPHVRRAVLGGEVAVNAVEAARLGVPSVKQRFAMERTQAKAINFGIIYGKTPASLAEDLGVDKYDAKGLMDRWFESKPGVTRWIWGQKREGWDQKRVISLLGRWRNMPLLDREFDPKYVFKSERAAVNFGIQGSAADVVMAAMLRLWRDHVLSVLGFRLVMQIHDEFVLEGPADAAAEAKARVVEVMEEPFAEYNASFRLRVPLRVDACVSSSFGSKA